MIKRIALLVIIVISGMSSFALAAELGNGVVDGRVVNETVGGSSVADLDVILKTYLNDAEINSTTTKTDIEGYFVFDGLSTELGYSYEVLISFQQAEYYGERLIFNEGETSKFNGVIVYDASSSDEANEFHEQVVNNRVFPENGHRPPPPKNQQSDKEPFEDLGFSILMRNIREFNETNRVVSN